MFRLLERDERRGRVPTADSELLLGRLRRQRCNHRTRQVHAARLRIRLLPLSGVEILFAKDLAWCSLLLLIA